MNMHITEIQPYRRIYSGSPLDTEINYDTNLKIGKFSAFGQVSKSYLDEKLSLSLGCVQMLILILQKCQILFTSYHRDFQHHMSLTDKLNLNFSTGRYYQLPPYTALGYSNPTGESGQ